MGFMNLSIDSLKKNFNIINNFSAESVSISTVSDLKNSKKNTLSFIADKSYIKFLSSFKSGLLFVDTKVYDFVKKDLKSFYTPNNMFIVIDNAYANYIKFINLYFSDLTKRSFKISTEINKINNTTIIHENVSLGKGISIGADSIIYPNVTIMDNVIIGANTIIYPNVTIYNNVNIGNNVIIHAGTVIGADGFGFLLENSVPKKIPHLGTVIIEDNVEIGANTCVDRGTISNTVIGKNSKIDNLVQVAHNCKLGNNCVLSAMTGLSGSTELEDNVIMAANAGTKGHLKIGKDSFVTARTSITKDIPPKSTVKGYPARNLQEELKIQTLVGKLPEIYKRLIKLEKENKF